MAVTFEGGRFANTSRTWQAAEEIAVTGWDKDTIGIFALGIGSSSHNGDTVTPELRWRNVTDAGSWTVLGATGEVKQATTTALTDDGNLSTGNFGSSSAKTAVTGNGCEQENSGVASSSTSLAQNEFTELQCGISFADGDPGDEYEFALYDGGAAEGTSVATVTLATAGTTYYETVTGALTFTGVVLKQTQKVPDLAGGLTFTGTLIASKLYFETLTGALTFTGDLIKQTQKLVTGELTSSGALFKRTTKILTGALTSSGALLKQTNLVQGIVGVLTFTGILTAVKLVVSGFRRFIGSGFFGGGRDR